MKKFKKVALIGAVLLIGLLALGFWNSSLVIENFENSFHVIQL